MSSLAPPMMKTPLVFPERHATSSHPQSTNVCNPGSLFQKRILAMDIWKRKCIIEKKNPKQMYCFLLYILHQCSRARCVTPLPPYQSVFEQTQAGYHNSVQLNYSQVSQLKDAVLVDWRLPAMVRASGTSDSVSLNPFSVCICVYVWVMNACA